LKEKGFISPDTGLISEDTKMVGYFRDEYKSLISRLSRMKGSYVIVVTSSKNTFLQEGIGVTFTYQPNVLVYKEGDLVMKTYVNGSEPAGEIENKLIKILGERVRDAAIKKGVLANPARSEQGGYKTKFSSSGEVGYISQSELNKKAKDISYLGGIVEVDVVANSDTYTIGPLNISFMLKPMSQGGL